MTSHDGKLIMIELITIMQRMTENNYNFFLKRQVDAFKTGNKTFLKSLSRRRRSLKQDYVQSSLVPNIMSKSD